MIDWDKIIESHVVNTFREVCYKWWGIDIQFYDEYGICKSKNIPLQNPLCHLIHSKTKGTSNCHQSYKKHYQELNKSLKRQAAATKWSFRSSEQTKNSSQKEKLLRCNSIKPFIYKCHAGLDGVACPLFVKEKYVGSIVGSGVKLSKRKDAAQQIDMKRLTMLGFDKTEVEQCSNKLQTVSDHSEAYILDFMELIAKDVMAFYELLQEKEELIKAQAVLRDKTYNSKYRGIIGTSQAMKKIFNTLDLIENRESTVLIEGETGTGKELIAAAVHYNSPRKNKMFVIQNCSAFSDSLLSSELFGHEKGSFTGAVSEKKGLFEIADEGTLFLDEIGDMNLEVQAKLLRVLENGTFYRVGGTEQRKVDVRIIAATNKELPDQIKKGLYRKDLFYRISTINITLPPLRERGEDILPLVNYFLDYYAETQNMEKKEISREVIGPLLSYHWPGNVRELKNVIERLLILSGKEKGIERRHVPEEIISGFYQESCVPENGRGGKGFQSSLKSLARRIIEEELKRSQWNKTIAASALGMSRASLNNKIEEFNIQPDKPV